MGGARTTETSSPVRRASTSHGKTSTTSPIEATAPATMPHVPHDSKSLYPLVEPQPTWTIYGRKYDLTEFMKHHPGGAWPLQLTKNSDATIMFESYHVFIKREKLGKMMARYEIVEEDSLQLPRTQLPAEDPLHGDLKQYARDFFADKGRRDDPRGRDEGRQVGGLFGGKEVLY